MTVPKHITKLLSMVKNSGSLERIYLDSLKIHSIKNGKIDCTVTTPYYNNTGFQTFLIDSVTTFACFDKTGKTGVSVSLDINRTDGCRKYGSKNIFNDSAEEREIRVYAEQLNASGNVAMQEAKIEDQKTGEVLCYGTHVKFL